MPDPTNPNRLEGSPALGEPALGVQPVAVVERSPTGLALVPQYVTRIALVLVAVAGVVVTLPSMGVALPPVVLTIAGAVLAIGTALGIASPGVRSKPGTVEGQVVSKTEAPRVGPPV